MPNHESFVHAALLIFGAVGVATLIFGIVLVAWLASYGFIPAELRRPKRPRAEASSPKRNSSHSG